MSKKRAIGVEVIDAETNEVMEFYSRIIFLNASTVGTTLFLLNSISNRFPNGLGNGSDQVGRNLMDHHKQAGATASVEGFEDKYYIGRRPWGYMFHASETLMKKEQITSVDSECRVVQAVKGGEV